MNLDTRTHQLPVMKYYNREWLVTFEWDNMPNSRPFPVGIANSMGAAIEVAANYRKSRDFIVDRTMTEVAFGLHRYHVRSESSSITGYIYFTLIDSFTAATAHEAYTSGRVMVR